MPELNGEIMTVILPTKKNKRKIKQVYFNE
jgi:hypothetical protein